MNTCLIKIIMASLGLSLASLLIVSLTGLISVLKDTLKKSSILKWGKAETDYVDFAAERVIRIQTETEKREDIKNPDRNAKIEKGQVLDTKISKMENMLADVLREAGVDQNSYNLNAVILGKINELENLKMI